MIVKTPVQVVPEPKKHWIRPKLIIFLWLSIISYVLMFFNIFGTFEILKSMIYVLTFFVFFHFLYLEIRNVPIRYLLYFMIALSIVEALIIGPTHYFLVAAILVINVGVVMLSYNLQGESNDKIRFSSWGYFNVGGYIFTVFIIIGYSLLLLWLYSKFPFTCEWLSQASNVVIDTVAKPFKIGMEQAKSLKQSTQEFFTSSKIKDIVLLGNDVALQETHKNSWMGGILNSINKRKQNLVDQAINDNTVVNRWICDYVLVQINIIYQNSAFRTSVLVLMFLLLYSFVRIVFYVMAGIGYVLFKILFLAKAYRVKMVMKEVEDLM